DILEDICYKDKRVPEVDRAEWTLRLAGAAHPIRVRLGAGRPPTVLGGSVEVVDMSGGEHNVRTITAIRLPAALFGKPRLQIGDTIHLECSFQTHARVNRNRWSGTFPLAQ